MNESGLAFVPSLLSARKRRLVLAPTARSDLRDIPVFTEQRWGKARRQAYRQQFSDAFADLARFPELGHPRPDYGSSIRGHPVGQDVVINQQFGPEPRIVRILHTRRDLDAELGESTT